jgi:hypothetical protein
MDYDGGFRHNYTPGGMRDPRVAGFGQLAVSGGRTGPGLLVMNPRREAWCSLRVFPAQSPLSHDRSLDHGYSDGTPGALILSPRRSFTPCGLTVFQHRTRAKSDEL